MIIIKPKQIADKYNLHNIVSKILYKRGFDQKWKLEQFLDPKLSNLTHPSSLPNIKKISNKIKQYSEFGDKIYAFTDYDQDGTSSAIILDYLLDKLNANYEIMISDRFRDGYGLSNKAIDLMSDAELILTADCGISNHEEIEYANSKNIDVIVLDHHEQDNPPNCDYIDLKVDKGNYSFNQLSGAALTWQVVRYILDEDLYNLLDITALSVIGDLVPLLGDNRIIAKYGLEKITNTKNVGLQSLKNELGISDKEITVGDVGFKLVPCVNAWQRLYGNNQMSFELLTTNDENKAKRLAKKLHEANEERKQMQKEGFESIIDSVNSDDNFIIGKGDFGKGVVGLIAQDLKEKFDKPSIVFGGNGDILKGSARSVTPLNMYEELCKYDNLLENYGGHFKAAGMSIHKENYDKFKKEILESTKDIDYETVHYDMKLDTNQINIPLIEELEVLQPCGMGNPSPKFFIKGVPTNIKTVGKTDDHYKFKLNGIDCIAFNMADESLSNEFIGSLDINEWNMQRSPQIIIRKIL